MFPFLKGSRKGTSLHVPQKADKASGKKKNIMRRIFRGSVMCLSHWSLNLLEGKILCLFHQSSSTYCESPHINTF
jgi:hypothetical protein